MKQEILHKADTRGDANHGWLHSRHTFSFANYHNPERIHFGALRVLNDDFVAPAKGFGEHPHDNMEIISIPLEGELKHKDSMGNTTVIKSGDVQIMSAGTGVVHSEYNNSETNPVKFLQIWVFPNKRNVQPRYDQITLNPENSKNKLQQIVSPNKEDEVVWINQNAWFHLGKFDKDFSVDYHFKSKENGLYAFVLKGDFEIDGQLVNERDGLGLSEISDVKIIAKSDDAKILLMEVPMEF